MIEVLLCIIVVQLGLLTIGLGTRLWTDAILIRETLAIKNRTAPGLPPGFRALTDDEVRAMGIDPAKLHEPVEKEEVVHGQYV